MRQRGSVVVIICLVCLVVTMAAFAAQPPTTTTTPEQAKVAQSNNAFAIELYSQLSRRPGNLFFSPESISTALAMTYAGAQSETAAEMSKTLHFTSGLGQLHAEATRRARSRSVPIFAE